MKSMYVYRLLLSCSVVMLAGCGRIIDWSKTNFYQGMELEQYGTAPHHYLRSVRVYDQFTTKAFFDVMWLSDDVKTAYANANALRFGKSDTLRKAFLRRQLEENRHYITFYVATNKSVILGDASSVWSLFLRVHDVDYAPQELKVVELSPEYRSFFGNKFNRFKNAYEVKFGTKDSEGKQVITPDTNHMTLYLRSLEKEATLSWPITAADTMGDYQEIPV